MPKKNQKLHRLPDDQKTKVLTEEELDKLSTVWAEHFYQQLIKNKTVQGFVKEAIEESLRETLNEFRP